MFLKIQWYEPWFFKLRSMSKTGWILHGVLCLSIYALFVALGLMELDSPRTPPGNLVELIIIPGLIALLIFAMIEGPMLQRVVVLTPDQIACVASPTLTGGLFGGGNIWNRIEIKNIQLLRQDENGNDYPYGLMVVTPKYAKSKTFAVRKSVHLEELAEFFSSVELDVILSGWPEKSLVQESHDPTFQGDTNEIDP